MTVSDEGRMVLFVVIVALSAGPYFYCYYNRAMMFLTPRMHVCMPTRLEAADT
jgi:hypothetical protein